MLLLLLFLTNDSKFSLMRQVFSVAHRFRVMSRMMPKTSKQNAPLKHEILLSDIYLQLVHNNNNIVIIFYVVVVVVVVVVTYHCLLLLLSAWVS